MERNFFPGAEFELVSVKPIDSGTRKIMSRFKIILAGIGASLLLAVASHAQTTNVPATLIETFEKQTDTVIVKGFSTVGSFYVNDATITVRSKESTDTGQGQKAYGIAIDFTGSGSGRSPADFIPKLSMKVDYDELESLAAGIEYLGKISYDVTPLAGFDASYTTKSGLRVIAHSDRRQGGIKTFIQFGDWPKIQLNSDQMTQLRSLIVQAKTSLDSIK